MRWCLLDTPYSAWYMVGPQLRLAIISYWYLQYYITLFWGLETKCVIQGLSHGRHIKTCKRVNTYRRPTPCQALFYLCTFNIHDNRERAAFLILISQMRTWSIKRLSNLPQVTQLLSDITKGLSSSNWVQRLCFYPLCCSAFFFFLVVAFINKWGQKVHSMHFLTIAIYKKKQILLTYF